MPTLTLLAALLSPAHAGVDPLLATAWGQGGGWQSETPVDADGAHTYAGCTTIAAAQILRYYEHQNSAAQDVAYGLDNDVTGPDIADGGLYLDLPAYSYDWDAMALTEDDSAAAVAASAEFIYHVGVTLNAQFGDPTGSPATGKQLENAFRYQWGFNEISRRSMSVISKDAFMYSDAEWAAVIQGELDAGRPVLYMALQDGGDAGHAFVIDGYRDDGDVHVNWGWGGYANGWYDPNTLQDPSGRRWNRQAMIFRGLEPAAGVAAAMMPAASPSGVELRWTGNGSLISAASGSATGYGLTLDEAQVYGGESGDATVFFQWEVDSDDGERLRIDADASADGGEATATITYGRWDDRAQDRVYADVELPFVLDPAADGFGDLHGEFFVVAVTVAGDGVVQAAATSAAGTAAQSAAADGPLVVDGHAWNGNGSVIANASGSATGYGLTHDEAMIRPGAGAPPVTFFQWEIDGDDGRSLEIGGDAAGLRAEVSYGPWNGHRGDDVRRTVTLPLTLDPAADGLSSDDGEYYVIRVAFEQDPAAATAVTATAR